LKIAGSLGYSSLPSQSCFGPTRFFKQPFDGKKTTPAFIPQVVKAIGEIKKLDAAIVAEQIMKNFKEFFAVKLN